ncbi:GNAT family N-acetyltransferase [Mariniblastus fucicola]|uniref:Acetyltransferase (GNAT) family protein n=1 Tax=Mariniblastus fucicola TaxID=980251 RepID=A0A5B9PB19_9BACT|nr:GNAT family N-acetyltransferase [Mariniblastus fucicola]QEG22170.1 Acetyltransferase (GNAT) family protein [Mariniblastus fucicola]
MGETRIRLAVADDCDGIVELIDGVLREYGDRICTTPGGSEADLLDIEAGYRDKGGEFWVLESIVDGRAQIVGTHATRPLSDRPLEVCTFKRLYLRRELRGTHWGHDLMQVTIDWTRSNGFGRIEFWSDTRFERAHRFFAKFGFVGTEDVRHMTDSVVPYSERFFYLDLK